MICHACDYQYPADAACAPRCCPRPDLRIHDAGIDDLDLYTFAHGDRRERLRPLAWVAAWRRIGGHFAVGYLHWCATGEGLYEGDGAVYPSEPASPGLRAEALVLLGLQEAE